MTTELEKVSRHYDEMADVYDHRYDRNRGRCYYSHISRFVLERLPEGGKILDIGCGTGLFVQEYLVNGGSAVGLDISRGMIGRARDRCPASDFTIGTAERIPFLDNTFDVVSSLLAFSYVKNPWQGPLRGIPCGETRRIYLGLHTWEKLLYRRPARRIPDRGSDEDQAGGGWRVRGALLSGGGDAITLQAGWFHRYYYPAVLIRTYQPY